MSLLAGYSGCDLGCAICCDFGWLLLVCWFGGGGFWVVGGVLRFVCLWFVLTLLLLALGCYGGWRLAAKVFLWLFVGLFGWCGYLCSPAVGGCLVWC